MEGFMNIPVREFRERAWHTLKTKGYWSPFFTTLITSIISTFLSPFLVGPSSVGAARFFITNSKEDNADLGLMISGFSNNFITNMLTGLLMFMFIALWSLLLIIPGIIATYAYAMVPFILSENPEISPTEAIRRSKEMMKGHKWNLFVLDLSFIGWYLLVLLTGGIGMIFLAPYVAAAKTEFYLELKRSEISAQEVYEKPQL
jgi:uncharacterized membrane protein